MYLPVYFVIRLQLLSAVGAELRARLHLLTARGADVRRFLLLTAVRAEFRAGGQLLTAVGAEAPLLCRRLLLNRRGGLLLLLRAHLEELRPEMGSYDCGSMNWLHTSLFLNPPAFLEELGKNMQEWGVKPEIEAFDPGMIANAAYYLKKGVLKGPLHFQFCMGCANGIVGSTKNLVFMKETMDSLCPGSTWSCFGVGHSAMEIMYAGVAMGGHIRVGMEDNVMYAKGQLAESNVQFVERAKRVIEEFGCQAATPDEARQILSLNK